MHLADTFYSFTCYFAYSFFYQAGTFREVFHQQELTPVDFVRLMDLAERRFIPEGEHLSEAGRVQDEVFLIVEGTAEVRHAAGVPH